MNPQETEQKRDKLLRRVGLVIYAIAGIVIAAKVLPMFWRVIT